MPKAYSQDLREKAIAALKIGGYRVLYTFS
jgi:mRNA-degrading endonuclease RelE of RelBE toxin-antitoxin system